MTSFTLYSTMCMQAPIRELQASPARLDRDFREDKCHWWKLFRWMNPYCLSNRQPLLVHLRNTGLSILSALTVCVCVYHYCMCRDGEWRAISGACPLGLHHKLLTDQERCLMLHRRRVIREGSVIFSHLYSGHTHPQTITHKSSFCHYREAFSSYQRDTR